MTEALNRGLALARGRIVGSLNADDRYHPDALAAVAQAWRGGGFRVVVGNVRIEDPARRPLYRQRPWPVVSALSWHALGCITPECSVFIHRSCLAHVGGFDERFRLAQDFELYLRLSRRYRFRHVDRTLSSFTAHPGQLSAEHAPALAAEVAAYYPHPWVRRVLVESALGSLLPILIGVRRYTARQRARLARARWQRLRAWPLRLS